MQQKIINKIPLQLMQKIYQKQNSIRSLQSNTILMTYMQKKAQNQSSQQDQDTKLNKKYIQQGNPDDEISRRQHQYLNYYLTKQISLPFIAEFQKQLQQSGIQIDLNNLGDCIEQTKIQHIQQKQNIFLISLKVGGYRQKINILVENKRSPFHKLKGCKLGTFGQVYEFTTNNQFTTKNSFKTKNNRQRQQQSVVKCMQLDMNKPNMLIFQLRQYFFLHVLSILKVAPKSNRLFGFDLIVWKDCIEFTMEKCIDIRYAHNYQGFDQVFKQLGQKLYIMHQLHIVHLDIKISNIMLNQNGQSFFIDFGCTKIINQKIGQLSKTQFNGTFQYACKQMKQVFLDSKQLVDLYYNDIYALQKCQQILKKEITVQINNNQIHKCDFSQVQKNCISQSMDFLLIKLKFFISMNDSEKLTQLLENYCQNEELVLNLLTYLISIKPCHNVRNLYFEYIKPNITNSILNKIHNKFKSIQLLKSTLNTFNNIYEIADYLELIMIKESQPFKIYNNQQCFSPSINLNKKFSQIMQKFSNIDLDYIQLTNKLALNEFMHLQNSQNIFYKIMNNEILLKSMEQQIYYKIYINSIDFTKNNNLNLQQKINLAIGFCSYQKIPINNRQKIGSNKLKNKFKQIYKSLIHLLDYCVKGQFNNFKIHYFNKIIVNAILICSINIQYKIQNYIAYTDQWIKKLFQDQKLSVHKKLELNFHFLQDTEIAKYTSYFLIQSHIFSNDTMNMLFQGLKQNNKISESQLIACEYYQELFNLMYFIKRSSDNNIRCLDQQKLLKVRQFIQKDFLIDAKHKNYLLKIILQLSLKFTPVKDTFQTLKLIYIYAEKCKQMEEFLQKKQNVMTLNSTLLLLRCKVFQSSITRYGFQKTLTFLQKIRYQINCDQIFDRMLLVQKIQLKIPLYSQNLIQVLKNVQKERSLIQILNIQALQQSISILRISSFDKNNITNSIQKKLIRSQFSKVMLAILQKLTYVMIEKAQNTNSISYGYFSLMQRLSSTDNSNFKQFYVLYRLYYNKTLSFNTNLTYTLKGRYLENVYSQNINSSKQLNLVYRNYEKIIMQITTYIQNLQTKIKSKNQSKNQFQDQSKNQQNKQTQNINVDNLVVQKLEPFSNLYFQIIQRMNKINQKLRDTNKIQQNFQTLFSFASDYNFFYCYIVITNLISEQLIIISKKLLIQLQTTKYQCNNNYNTIMSNFDDQATNSKQKIWNFIWNISLALIVCPAQPLVRQFILQIQIYMCYLHSKIKKQVNKPQILLIAEFLVYKILNLNERTLKRNVFLVYLLIQSLKIQKYIQGNRPQNELKILWKITGYINFCKPFLKQIVLDKYYRLTKSYGFKNSNNRKKLLIQQLIDKDYLKRMSAFKIKFINKLNKNKFSCISQIIKCKFKNKIIKICISLSK